MASLFEVDPETNEIVYEQVEESEVEADESGTVSDEDSNTGFVLDDETETSEEEVVVSDSANTDNGVMLLSEEVVETLLASSPASGSLNSSTIDYFDRLVDGLPADYGYIAFRNDVSDAYAGTIVYGKDWDYNDGTVIFGEGAVEVDVSRTTSGSGSYSSYITYNALDASDSFVEFSQSGSVLYYTNVTEGYPVLGSGARPFDIDPFIVVGLISAMACAVVSKLINRRV